MESTEKILSYLEDEQSEFIYQKRVEYNETGDFNAIKAIVARYLPQLRDKLYYLGMEGELLKQLENKRNRRFKFGDKPAVYGRVPKKLYSAL